jgi:two-component system, OmpR family, sensor histidine kinase VicK
LNDANYFTPTLLSEKTEVLYDPDDIVKRVVEQCNTIKYTMDVCIDANGPSMLVIPNHPVTQSIMDMKNRGVRSRFISEITKDNLSYCEELAKIGEIRHLD